MPSFPIVTLANDNFLPRSFVSVNPGAGAVSGAAPLKVLLIGNALATSAAVVGSFTNVVYGPDVEGFSVSSELGVVQAFGRGSELHTMYREFVAINSSVPVYLIAAPESTGNAASQVVTFAGTATAAGSVRTYIADVFVDAGINIGDGYIAVAANVAAQCNSNLNSPVNAVASNGTVTFTAKQKGPRGNDIRGCSRVNGSGVGITSSQTVFAQYTGGTVEDVWTGTLAAIANSKYTRIVAAGEDSTTSGNLGLLASQVSTQALPYTGIRQRVFASAGSVALSTATTFIKNLNNTRVGVVWQLNGNKMRGQLAAHVAAGVTALENAGVPEVNFDFLGARKSTIGLINVQNPYDGTVPSQATLVAAVAAGLSALANGNGGKSYLTSMLTSYSQDPSTGNIDSSVRDWGTLTVMDFAADLADELYFNEVAGKKLAADPPPGQALPVNTIATPNQVKASFNRDLANMVLDGLVPQAQLAELQASTKVIIDSARPDRLLVNFQVQPIALAHQLGVNVNQVSLS